MQKMDEQVERLVHIFGVCITNKIIVIGNGLPVYGGYSTVPKYIGGTIRPGVIHENSKP